MSLLKIDDNIIKVIALNNGFRIKRQANFVYDLDPCLYDFAKNLLALQHQDIISQLLVLKSEAKTEGVINTIDDCINNIKNDSY